MIRPFSARNFFSATIFTEREREGGGEREREREREREIRLRDISCL